MVTVEDAVAKGCHLFDIEQLKKEYSDNEYKNLLMCQFVDGQASVFSFHDLQQCMVDSWDVWKDFTPQALHPYDNKPVWIGYDPSRTRDDASCVVIAPPKTSGGTYRVLEKHSWNNLNFDAQAKHIQNLTQRYHVEHIAVDTSGMGLGVFELVQQFFPRACKITYSVEVKNRMVLKALQLVQHRRLEFDAGARDIAMAFLTIHKTATDTGRHITYKATRTQETGHADVAWAIMHALDKEPLTTFNVEGNKANTNIVEFYS